MSSTSGNAEASGMEVVNLQDNREFARRRVRPHDSNVEIEAMHRLAHVFALSPSRILRELTEVSVSVCGADSAGVSLEEVLPDGEVQFRWVATAGIYAPYLDGVLPRFYSPCGTCLERHQAQLFRVSQAYLNGIGIEAPAVTDGLLIPWQVDQVRGTIWIVAHQSYELFDREDFRILQGLSYFAAIAVRHQHQQRIVTERAASTAAAEMARELAHQINNPLQSLMNTVFLASHGDPAAEAFAREVNPDLHRLSALVQQLLNLPAQDKAPPD